MQENEGPRMSPCYPYIIHTCRYSLIVLCRSGVMRDATKNSDIGGEGGGDGDSDSDNGIVFIHFYYPPPPPHPDFVASFWLLFCESLYIYYVESGKACGPSRRKGKVGKKGTKATHR